MGWLSCGAGVAITRRPRRKPNGMLYLLVASAALAHPVSREWKGYWQRSNLLFFFNKLNDFFCEAKALFPSLLISFFHFWIL